MNFILTKGRDFSEHFNFRNAQGRAVALPSGTFRIALERGSFIQEYTVENGGLARYSGRLDWRISSKDSQDFDFTTMYYTLYLNDSEVTRGILRVQ